MGEGRGRGFLPVTQGLHLAGERQQLMSCKSPFVQTPHTHALSKSSEFRLEQTPLSTDSEGPGG